MSCLALKKTTQNFRTIKPSSQTEIASIVTIFASHTSVLSFLSVGSLSVCVVEPHVRKAGCESKPPRPACRTNGLISPSLPLEPALMIFRAMLCDVTCLIAFLRRTLQSQVVLPAGAS